MSLDESDDSVGAKQPRMSQTMAGGYQTDTYSTPTRPGMYCNMDQLNP